MSNHVFAQEGSKVRLGLDLGYSWSYRILRPAEDNSTNKDLIKELDSDEKGVFLPGFGLNGDYRFHRKWRLAFGLSGIYRGFQLPDYKVAQNADGLEKVSYRKKALWLEVPLGIEYLWLKEESSWQILTRIGLSPSVKLAAKEYTTYDYTDHSEERVIDDEWIRDFGLLGNAALGAEWKYSSRLYFCFLTVYQRSILSVTKKMNPYVGATSPSLLRTYYTSLSANIGIRYRL